MGLLWSVIIYFNGIVWKVIHRNDYLSEYFWSYESLEPGETLFTFIFQTMLLPAILVPNLLYGIFDLVLFYFRLKTELEDPQITIKNHGSLTSLTDIDYALISASSLIDTEQEEIIDVSGFIIGDRYVTLQTESPISNKKKFFNNYESPDPNKIIGNRTNHLYSIDKAEGGRNHPRSPSVENNNFQVR